MGRRRDLDGLRGVALLCVLAYHFSALLHVTASGRNPFVGGFLGVDIFFVLSGCLITGLLVDEWDRAGTISLRSFYHNRIRRLVPAMLVMLAIHAVFWVSIGNPPRSELRADAWILPDLANFGHIANDLVVGIGHTWSLSIEEQFYFLWPPLLLVILRYSGLQTARRVALLLVGVGVAVTAARYHQTHDMQQGYFGSVPRGSELLIGCFAGLLRGRVRPPSWLRVLAVIIFVGLLAYARTADGWLYEGGTLLVDLPVAILILPPARETPGWGTALLASRPLRFFGRVSYSVYLYSVPVTLEILQYVPSHYGRVFSLALDFSITGALSWLSYNFVEKPLRLGPLNRVPRWYPRGRALAPVVVVAGIAVAAGGLVRVHELLAALVVVVCGLAVAGVLVMARPGPRVRPPVGIPASAR